jgi:hypothetical protein
MSDVRLSTVQRLSYAMDHQRTTFNAYYFQFFCNGLLIFIYCIEVLYNGQRTTFNGSVSATDH